MRNFIPILIVLFSFQVNAQTNIQFSDSTALEILKGNFDPAVYASSNPISDPKVIAQALQEGINAENLKENIIQLGQFFTRNTYSTQTNDSIGIGATMKWIFTEFATYGAQNDDRLIPFYLSFDQANKCDVTKNLYNTCAVLPGTDTSNKEIIIFEAHVDSRCENTCDSTCYALGIEDNASGTALVMELARAMSKYSFKQSIVFMATTGEEQGLLGATAFAQMCRDNNIEIEAVLNNDVIGGIICGKTSSEPSCPFENDIDSLNVRLFSEGTGRSLHKGLARYTKLQYEEELKPFVKVPMTVNIMNPEDRTGRGGDHIPFRQRGFTSIRFTSANEHGNASPVAGYTDRQHTGSDTLGVDTDSDGEIDSFFVDFNYLKRNATINAVTATMAAQGPETPEFELINDERGLMVKIINPTGGKYRIGVRTTVSNDWEALHEFEGDSAMIPGIVKDKFYFISVAKMDNQDVESLFAREEFAKAAGGISTGFIDYEKSPKGMELLPARPNPADETTTLSVAIYDLQPGKSGTLVLTDLAGKILKEYSVDLGTDLVEIEYYHGYQVAGIYTYTLMVDGKPLQSKKVIFQN
ncbi:MAG: hypothetical protein ACJATA_000188 [Sphingobacteriales bacterium]|jgi:hypothetical protein